MEVLVFEAIDELLEKYEDICACDICRTDIVAYALNSLPPKYIATETGEVYSKLSTLQSQTNSDVLSAIIKAIMRVSKNPRCSNKNS